MKFSTRSTYGLRAMVAFTMHYGRGSILLRDVAEQQQLPITYLEQLMVPLRKAGLVMAKRGSNGGYTLASDPATITIGDVLLALEGPLNLVEGPMHLVDCEAMAASCGVTHKCALKELLDGASKVLTDYFHETTLASLAARQRAIEEAMLQKMHYDDYCI